MEEKRELRRADGLEYELVRRRVKNINLRVRADGTVAASAGRRVSGAAVDRFVARHRDWVERAVAQVNCRRAALEAQPLPDRAAALAEFEALSRRVYPAFAAVLGGQPPAIRVRDMSSRWGVCHIPKRTITLALRLALQPPAAREYVMVHEYCHFIVPNHSPAFWAEVEKLLPDWKARRKLLRLAEMSPAPQNPPQKDAAGAET